MAVVVAQPTPVAGAQKDELPKSTTIFSGTEGAYMLPHHIKEIERLQKQHRFMNSTTKGQLLVTPSIHGHSALLVLDAGCADGTWLLDLPRQLPEQHLELYGVDIGSNLFPKSETIKDGVSLDLREHNIVHSFPKSWQWSNSFDIIHQRLLIWGIKSAEWPIVVRNLVEVLKPGGYIQLVEAEWINHTQPASLPQLRKQAALQQWSTEAFGMDINIAYQLEELLREAGLENVTKVQYDHGYGAKATDPAQADVSAELWVECFRTLDSKIEGDGILDVARDREEFQNFLDDLEEEIKKFGYQPKLNLVYGRKPL